jgi:hypothetical protein
MRVADSAVTSKRRFGDLRSLDTHKDALAVAVIDAGRRWFGWASKDPATSAGWWQPPTP